MKHKEYWEKLNTLGFFISCLLIKQVKMNIWNWTLSAIFYFTKYFLIWNIVSPPDKYLWLDLFKSARNSFFFLIPFHCHIRSKAMYLCCPQFSLSFYFIFCKKLCLNLLILNRKKSCGTECCLPSRKAGGDTVIVLS